MEKRPEVVIALKLGAARLVKWTQDGTLVSPADAGRHWGLELIDLKAAVRRGDLFEVWVNMTPYIPAELLVFSIEQASTICRSLKGQSATSKLLFLLRAHGGLGGRSIAQALRSGTPMGRICDMAEEANRS